MRRPNHASRFEGIAKTKLQASRASDTETLQSQVNKAAEKRLSLSGLEVLHGRRVLAHRVNSRPGGTSVTFGAKRTSIEPRLQNWIVSTRASEHPHQAMRTPTASSHGSGREFRA